MSKKEPRPPATLRFAALIRVSTEKQEQRGESLRTQEKQINEAVTQLGGTITKRYAGQEHATEGWEREQLEKLLADTQKPHKPFNCVMVADQTRWGRDNVKADTGLDILRDKGIRFFILNQEYDLFNPEAKLFLSMAFVIGAYQARMQTKKSLDNRIERAKRGWPTCGKLPYGRTFDKDTGKWGIDRKAQAMVRDVAGRYLGGESMADLAREYGINHSFLHITLTTRCGTVWEQRFRSPKLNIDVTVPITVPALLKPNTITAVRRRAAANKTYSHGHLTHRYLFSRMVFCATCGYAMSGQTNPNGRRYYRHAGRNGAADCPLEFRPWAPADLLELTVLAHLAELWGNPKAVEKALADAEPNRAEIARHRKRLERIEDELAKIKIGRQRLVKFIVNGSITDNQAESQLESLNERETALTEEADRLHRQLANTLSSADRKRVAERVVMSRRTWAKLEKLRAKDPVEMTWEQRRMLVEDVFGGTTPDGRRMGVYVSPIDTKPNMKHRRWRYEIHGKIQGDGLVKDSAELVDHLGVTSLDWY